MSIWNATNTQNINLTSIWNSNEPVNISINRVSKSRKPRSLPLTEDLVSTLSRQSHMKLRLYAPGETLSRILIIEPWRGRTDDWTLPNQKLPRHFPKTNPPWFININNISKPNSSSISQLKIFKCSSFLPFSQNLSTHQQSYQ